MINEKLDGEKERKKKDSIFVIIQFLLDHMNMIEIKFLNEFESRIIY